MRTPPAPELVAAAAPPADAGDAYQALLDDVGRGKARRRAVEDLEAFAAHVSIATPAAACAWLVTLEPRAAGKVGGKWVDAMQSQGLAPELITRRFTTLYRLCRIARRSGMTDAEPPAIIPFRRASASGPRGTTHGRR